MEKPDYPDFLVVTDSAINISFDKVSKFNRTESSIIISGNREGFISLANLLNVYNSYLYTSINVFEFSFVKSSIFLSIEEDNEVYPRNGKVMRVSDLTFKWFLSETNLYVMTGLIHSLGYANNELHLDADLNQSDTSVYCIVS